MSDLVLYSNPQSRGQIVHWMLEELAEPYEVEWIEYGPAMKTSPFIDINPMGKVPAITHNGNAVTEVPAICTYLAARFPDKGLIPSQESEQLGNFYRWMFFAAGPLEQAVTAHSMNWDTPEDKQQTLGFGSYQLTLDVLEIALQKGPYICGEQFTAVDVYLGSHLTWGLMFETIEKRQAFEDYSARLVQRPAAIRATKINAARMKATPT